MLSTKRKEVALAILIKLGVALYLVTFARYQTDPHHDGYILGSAAAVADGHVVHSGGFSQYGPVTPWLAGFFFKLTSISVLNLRLLSAILIFLTYVILEKLIIKLEFSWKTSQLLPVFWILVNHVTTTTFDGAFFLWPSLVSTLLLLFSLFLSINSIDSPRQKSLLLVAGTFIGFAFLTRIQSILTFALLLLFSFVVFKKVRNTYPILLGIVLVIALTYFYLYFSGGFGEYFVQVIQWPATAYPSLGSGNNYNRFQFVLYISLPAACVLYFFILRKISLRATSIQRAALVVIFGIGTFLVQYMSGKLLLSDRDAYLRLIIGDQFNRIIFWPTYLCFMSTFVLAGFFLFNRVLVGNKEKKQIFYVSSFGISVTPQIFPQPDIAHLWWITPLLILPTLMLIRILRIQLNPFSVPISSILVASVLTSFFYLQRDWKEYTYEPLWGTFASTTKAKSVEVYKPLEIFLKKNNAIFLCHDGLHSSASGRYSSYDQWFVNWGPLQNHDESKRLWNARNVVICDKDRKYTEKLASEYRYKILLFDEIADGDTYRSLAILARTDSIE